MDREINQGYLDHIKALSRLRTAVAARPSPEGPTSLFWKSVAAVSKVLPRALKQQIKPGWVAALSGLYHTRRKLARWLQVALTPCKQVFTAVLLVLTSIVLGVYLKLSLWAKGAPMQPLNERAIGHVPAFIEQYPLHLYPVVLKSFELAFLKPELQRLRAGGARFVEMAIGEGTFSAKIFPPDAEVVGLDLNPYSLWRAAQLPHVKQAIICDCLRPPVRGGHFDALLANNFMHHVTMKEQTLANWSRVARRLIFNESTPYWAAGWATPFVLKRLGFKVAARRAADRIERDMLQHLEPMEAIDALVRREFEVVKCDTYFSERTFFLCAVYSFIMGCFGPPTPAFLKSFFLGRYMRRVTLPLTAWIAKLLIRYDQSQDRSRDVYVSYICESRHVFEPSAENYLVCPRCGGGLSETDHCGACRRQYSRQNRMLFLLPEELEYVETAYDPDSAKAQPREHL